MKEVIVPADDLVCLGKEKLQEVIRCKDCKWFDPCEWSSKYGKCHAMKHGYKSNGWDIGIYRMTNSNDFCSSAEREEIE